MTAAASPWGDPALIAAAEREKNANAEALQRLVKALIDEILRQHPSIDANMAASMAIAELALTHARISGLPDDSVDMQTYFETPMVAVAAMICTTAKPGKALEAAEKFGALLRSRIALRLSMGPELAS